MGTYSGIKGYMIQSLASDPSPTASVVGQMWYNSTSNTWKIALSGGGAWSTGGVLNSVGREDASGAGTQTAAIAIAGYHGPPGAGSFGNTEEYNGTAWAEVNNITTVRYGHDSTGLQTALIAGGGGAVNAGETYDGTSWTDVGAMSRSGPSWGQGGVSGTMTAAVFGFGAGGGGPTGNIVESFDGSCFAADTAGITARSTLWGFGGAAAATAAIVVGGQWTAADAAYTEEWNGTAWAEVADLNNPRGIGNAASGTTTAGLIAGGYQGGPIGKTETWDGTSWSEVGDLQNARGNCNGTPAGTSSEAACYAGSPNLTMGKLCEEFDSPVYAIETVTTS